MLAAPMLARLLWFSFTSEPGPGPHPSTCLQHMGWTGLRWSWDSTPNLNLSKPQYLQIQFQHLTASYSP